ncbi:MAG: acyltransferase [Anaerolineaceae bacterium]|nr:acyltransferase [Anaerolineaceae bacterium]
MAQISLHSTDKTPVVVAKSEKASRLFYIDHLRSALIILVVLHHVALVYGASLEGYYYVEPPFTSPLAFKALLIFALVNQAWFMGAFFLLSGYFTPGSFDRKGMGAFLKDRLLRLGIPLLVFYFILSPISFIGFWLMPPALTGITEPLTWQIFWQAYPDLIGLGPLWFVAMLLIFSVGYAIWRAVLGKRTVTPSAMPGYLAVGIFIVVLALASTLMRMVIPLGESWYQFPTLAYLPQYLSFFVLGAVASRKEWLRTLSGTMGFVGFVVAGVTAVILFPLAFSGQWFSLELTEALDNAMGNGHWQSAVYALWDSAFAVGLSLGLITLFRRFVNGRGGFGRFLSVHSYTVYIIHMPIVVFMAYALRGIELESLQKFGLASVIIVPICFIAAYLVRKIPFASKIL